MKEREVNGLVELKAEYENKLSQNKEYQELRDEFNRGAMTLMREAIMAKGIKFDERALLAHHHVGHELVAKSCGFCEDCITGCTDCVAYS